MNFLEELKEDKEFRTEFAELKHRDRREVPDWFSVHSVLRGFDITNG
jgi:hypothetical protein